MSEAEYLETVTGPGSGDLRERGARRKRVYGYLKAANELRHSYQAQRTQRNNDGDGDEQGVPGAFPDIEFARSGDEELVLFPSYARKHYKKFEDVAREMPGAHEDIEKPQSSGDADYWRKEWERYEDDNAIVDVDVRGWMFTPHRGPMNRKNRLLVAVARRVTGIPAPHVSPEGSRTSSRHSTHKERIEERSSRHEDEAAAKEAQSLVQRGEGEAEAAWRGSYSTEPDRNLGDDISPMHSRSTSPVVSDEEDPGQRSLAKRKTWTQPSNMTREEMASANAHLMTRLKPFMSIPLASTPISIFFFNHQRSQSKSISTNESGHFSLRASLGFVPTSVRVLASETLSITEHVIVTEAKGVSLISDIDDTIKHSAISKGAKEIFKNTFIRELEDLTIQGVKEWYSKLFALGVKLHYVSNSPWQLYPLLRSYFSLAGLPPGSFHLKQYSGMLQGIFEPAAERKRGSLERIMADFPERRFILVGDSGEADLEVYTEVVTANPGRVLGVFIRDVTTAEKKKFFDQTMSNPGPDSKISRNVGKEGPRRHETFDAVEFTPSFPERPIAHDSDHKASLEGNLIDFDENPHKMSAEEASYNADLLELDRESQKPHKSGPPPVRPKKPAELRSVSSETITPTNHQRMTKSESAASRSPDSPSAPKLPPPKPRRPSYSVNLSSTQAHPQPPGASFSPSHQDQQQPPPIRPDLGNRSQTTTASSATTSSDPKSSHRTMTSSSNHQPPPREEEGYAASARRQLASAYSALPSIRSSSPASEYRSRNPSDPSSSSSSVMTSNPTDSNPPPVPPRRGLTSYPAAAAHYASNRIGWASGANPGGVIGPPADTTATVAGGTVTYLNKKEVRIVQANLKEMQHEEGGMGISRRHGSK